MERTLADSIYLFEPEFLPYEREFGGLLFALCCINKFIQTEIPPMSLNQR